MKDFFKSPRTKTLLYTLCGILIILIIFGMGIIVGYRRANFAMRWDENYENNFLGAPFPGSPPPMGMSAPPSFNTHGVVGEVIDVGSSTISVEDSDGDEQSVFISSGTPIRELSAMIPLVEIKIGDHVTVIGEPNDSGQVEARFIRVFETGTTTQ